MRKFILLTKTRLEQIEKIQKKMHFRFRTEVIDYLLSKYFKMKEDDDQ